MVRDVSYRFALLNDGSRSDYCKSFERDKPPFVRSVGYVTNAELEQLVRSMGVDYRVPPGAWSKTFLINPDQLGRGSVSDVFLIPNAFPDNFKNFSGEVKDDLGLVIENVVRNHEFVHARHYNQGFEAYPFESFKDKSNNFNATLFAAVTELLAHASEYRGLKRKVSKAKSKFLPQYLVGIQKLARPFYDWLLDQKVVGDMDPEFVAKLREELNPATLFK